jgi:hypothetical protein
MSAFLLNSFEYLAVESITDFLLFCMVMVAIVFIASLFVKEPNVEDCDER